MKSATVASCTHQHYHRLCETGCSRRQAGGCAQAWRAAAETPQVAASSRVRFRLLRGRHYQGSWGEILCTTLPGVGEPTAGATLYRDSEPLTWWRRSCSLLGWSGCWLIRFRHNDPAHQSCRSRQRASYVGTRELAAAAGSLYRATSSCTAELQRRQLRSPGVANIPAAGKSPGTAAGFISLAITSAAKHNGFGCFCRGVRLHVYWRRRRPSSQSPYLNWKS